MAWLGTWEKRIKLTTDNTKIDSDLSHFPLTVFLKAVNGDTENVFTEVTTSSKKIAVTKADGTTQLYVEIEKWDNPNQLGVLHCGIDGDIMASAADTDYYIYYDSAQADNTTYVGDKNSTPAQSVWDANFKIVQHLADGVDNAHIYDSTSNNNDGTKAGAANPAEAVGQVGKGQVFVEADGSYIDIPDGVGGGSAFTISLLYKSTAADDSTLYGEGSTTSAAPLADLRVSYGDTNGKVALEARDDAEAISVTYSTSATWVDGNWHYVAGIKHAGNSWELVIDGVSRDTDVTSLGATTINRRTIGGLGRDPRVLLLDGTVDEVRTSIIGRSVAWAKAEYNSLFDSLLTYGTEENIPSGNTTNFFQFFN